MTDAAVVHKSIDIKAVSDQGEVSALISTFGLDRDGDIMTAQAFARSAGKSIPMVWSHDWDQPVGKGVVEITDAGAVYNGQFFLDTERGVEAYKTVRAMGDLQQYSIGFRILADSWGTQTDASGKTIQVRTITDLELFEASPVLVGAAYGTGTLAIKTGASTNGQVVEADPDRADIVTLGTMLVDIDRLAAEVKAGRTLSNRSMGMVHSIMQAAADLHGAMPCDMPDCPMNDGAETALGDFEQKRIAAARADIDRALAARKR